ncbi:hypothetical protein [Polaromonas jejuensis]|uniref:Uncharacterized protein n=1 Tax=Polaromonas jejuensis TaxID=457502 RepID=A0ABW0QDX6_9BURK|nr:hypothetical protein [Polaromonas jejuensis]
MASTKSGAGVSTYAQNPCCGAALQCLLAAGRYQSHSARKSLIHMGNFICHFSGHSKESLDLQGLDGLSDKLSTKLSTENLDISKAVKNQGLSALSACVVPETHVSDCSP